MGRSSMPVIRLTISILLLGSIIQTSQSLENSDYIRMSLSTGRENVATDILASKFIFHSESNSDSVEGSGQTSHGTALKLNNRAIISEDPDRAGNEHRSGSGTTLTTTPALVLKHSGAHDPGADQANISITEEEAVLEDRHFTIEEHFKESQSDVVNENLLDGVDSSKHPIPNNVFTSITKLDLSGPGVTCVRSPCVVFSNFNGTNLLWDDMRRTLAFAWELHVYGSASLFILIAALAVVGTAGACTHPCAFCDSLILANTLLILSGTLRGVFLLLDPYGTRQILSRATLAALHNVPLQLLLWAQFALALVTLKGLNLMLFPLKLQRPWVVGVLAMSICTLLLLADLFSPSLSPALPLLLQTLSLCWGLPICIVILIKSFSHLHPVVRSSVPQGFFSQRIEGRAKRVIAVCAFLGVLCFSLQMYSLLWLYGLLGNWRRFGWGWWLSQFWARILEASWGFSLLVLGSWIFWTPTMVQSRGDHAQSRSEASKMMADSSLWGSILARIRKGPLRKTEKTWEDLMPNNWAKYNLSRTGFCNNAMCPYDDPPSTITQEYKADPVSKSSSSESQAALLWQQVSERDCILSLIEFDIGPPSPINLRRSIDNALHHEQLVEGGLFTAPTPSWAHSVGRDTPSKDCGKATVPTGRVGYRWRLDTEPSSESQDNFGGNELIQSPSTADDCYSGVWPQATAHHGEDFHSAAMYPQDWSEDDVTDL